MALKDWKERKYGYRSNNEKLSFNTYFEVPKYEVNIRYLVSSNAHTIKTFKLKSQALKYAKAYMRTH